MDDDMRVSEQEQETKELFLQIEKDLHLVKSIMSSIEECIFKKRVKSYCLDYSFAPLSAYSCNVEKCESMAVLTLPEHKKYNIDGKIKEYCKFNLHKQYHFIKCKIFNSEDFIKHNFKYFYVFFEQTLNKCIHLHICYSPYERSVMSCRSFLMDLFELKKNECQGLYDNPIRDHQTLKTYLCKDKNETHNFTHKSYELLDEIKFKNIFLNIK